MALPEIGSLANRRVQSGTSIQCTETGRRARRRKAVWRVFKRYREIMESRKSGESSESGFTLIELLIVIVVLGILAAIVVFSLTGISGSSKTAACTTDAKTVETAAEAYQAAPGNNNAWPNAVSLLVPSYLHAAPTTANGYSISLDSTTVQVAIGTGAAADFTGTCPTVS
jgi:prepilin-type N-terminal cleavage/methylation domain-containing protein